MAALWACLGGSSLAVAVEGMPAAWRALDHGGELSCAPSLPTFCVNMHVQCAGRTAIATHPFQLRTEPDSMTVALTSPDPDTQRRFDGAASEWAADRSYLLLWPSNVSGYVKLMPDGRYAHRHYVEGRGVMSLGQCRSHP